VTLSQLVLRVRYSTPAAVGSHDPLKMDPLGIRVTEIKGIWRWWARSFVAGVLYDKGYLRGKRGQDALRIPTEREARAISCLVGKVLGLGYVGERGAEASRYKILAIPLGKKSQGGVNVQRLQRIKLLELGGRVEYDVGLEFEIRVSRRISTDTAIIYEPAIKVLLVMLQLSGVGKGSRRGLGSLDIIDISDRFVPRDLRSLIESAYSGVEKAIETHGNECGLRDLSGSSGARDFLPPLPCVSKSMVGGVYVSRIYVSKGVSFEDIHNFFLRSERCKRLYGNPRCYDELRKMLNSWFLGLPRSQRRTGYIIRSKEISRRASSILISYHSRDNFFGDGAFISFLLSEDWPSEIEWVGRGSQSIKLDTRRIIDASKIAYDELNKYLNGNIGAVWP
jgi:CRISPR-associated protein Cmr1